MSREIVFKIDVWTPETLPRERLGEYLIELARPYGEPASVHFRKLRKGSAVVVSDIDEPAIPKVERRLALTRAPQAPKDVVEACRRIDEMLADDNATGLVRFPRGAQIIAFPGRDRPKPVDYGRGFRAAGPRDRGTQAGRPAGYRSVRAGAQRPKLGELKHLGRMQIRTVWAFSRSHWNHLASLPSKPTVVQAH